LLSHPVLVENRPEVCGNSRTEEAAVDFIERWLHISPDGGNGTFELVIYVVLFVALVAVARMSRRGGWRR
jgi:hypothetical protein